MIVVLAAALILPMAFHAQTPPRSVDTGECGEGTPAQSSTLKTPVFIGASRAFRAYGEISYQRISKDGEASRCRVVSSLFVASGNKPFRKIKQLVWAQKRGNSREST
jgi:hypothetical protein